MMKNLTAVHVMLMELFIKHKKLITASEFKVLHVQYVFGDDGLT